jgi:hypothetical protein
MKFLINTHSYTAEIRKACEREKINGVTTHLALISKEIKKGPSRKAPLGHPIHSSITLICLGWPSSFLGRTIRSTPSL